MAVAGDFSELPVVDFGRWSGDPDAREAFAGEVADICHQVGFFLLVNHGIEAAFVDDVFAMMRRLFALTPEEKLLIDKRNSPHYRGWEGEGTEYTNNRPDIREQVDLWTEHLARDPSVSPEYLRLLGPNQWFPEEVLPGFRSLLGTWFARMGSLADELLRVFATGLGLDANHFESMFGGESMSLTKLIRYPPTPPGEAGVNAHHDAAFLTLLAPGETPGLQVQNAEDVWVPVQPEPGAFVVNLGEMLQGMTGNYFVATPHRVITDGLRLSAGYFHGPSLDTELAPLPLPARFAEAVAASPRHAEAGYMASVSETDAGVGDMGSTYKPATYGEQLWNYFIRSYGERVS